MRKALMFVSFLVLVPLLAFAEEFKALGLVLGESKQAAVGKFNDKNVELVREEADVSVYTDPLVKLRNGKTTELEFHQDRLMRVRVYIKMSNDRFQEFKKHYDSLKVLLYKKYGRPSYRRELIPGSFEGNLSASMFEGEVGYGVIFQSGDVDIKLMLKNKDERTYRYFLEYEDREMKKKKLEDTETTLDVL